MRRYKREAFGARWAGDPAEASLGDSEAAGRLVPPSSSIFNGTGPGRAYVSSSNAAQGDMLDALRAGGGLSPAGWFGGGGFRWRLASEGAHTTLHQDVMSNTFVEVVGVKRFHLFPPEMWAELTMWPEWHSCARQSVGAVRDRGGAAVARELGAAARGGAARRNATAARPYAVVDLRPGELLMLPTNWFHRVECISAEPCQSVSIFWPTPTGILCQHKLSELFPGFVDDGARSSCHAREVFGRPSPASAAPAREAQREALRRAGRRCGHRMPGADDSAPAACLDALAEWHHFLLAIAAAQLERFPPLLALHPELEAGATERERARLFVRMLYRSRYAPHT
ncbi:MAG: cupin-like domain-containing protein, partial [Planctomycetota bacterium]|nr:cupin-like domain-containing protein [Planctomycetota bacterium]